MSMVLSSVGDRALSGNRKEFNLIIQTLREDRPVLPRLRFRFVVSRKTVPVTSSSQFKMRSATLLALLCLSSCTVLVRGMCTVSKYEEGFGDRVRCTNTNLTYALNQGGARVSAIMILQSDIQRVPNYAFSKFASTLAALHMHDCRISDIGENAFADLGYLKKLSLPNNNITTVKAEWFVNMRGLEQLDLSFNTITSIDPRVFGFLVGLKRLDVSENRLVCLDPKDMTLMSALDKVRFAGNPLTLRCRGKLTLWLRDRGVNYKSDARGQDTWLDHLLWVCTADAFVAESELLVKECVLLSLFNQLRGALTTGEYYPVPISQECVNQRNILTTCLFSRGHMSGTSGFTNGNVVRKLLMQLEKAKSA